MQKKVVLLMLSVILVCFSLVLLLLGCSQDVDMGTLVNVFSGVDNSYPVLESVSSYSSSVVLLQFSEPVKVYGSSFEPFTARADGKFVYVTLNSTLEPGKASALSGRVRDYSGNTVGFTITVWGFNPYMPGILINEFTTKGTERSPDRTELLVLEDGNINGMALYGGTPDDHDSVLVFGDMSVKRGDLVVVWWTRALPAGVEYHPDQVTYNICAMTEEDLPSNNGTLVLCDTPSLGSHVLDAVVYSNFSSSHEGYGTKNAYQRAQWVLDCGAWTGDPLDSTTSTATRSMSRNLSAVDSDTASDWYITVTGGSTFGAPNSTQAY